MATTWSPERRAKQAAMIHTWRPWAKSTGPRSPVGKERVARNAWKGGHLVSFGAEASVRPPTHKTGNWNCSFTSFPDQVDAKAPYHFLKVS